MKGLLLGIFIICISGIVAFFIVSPQQKILPKVLSLRSVPVTFHTYTNHTYGFSFSFPQDYIAHEIGTSEILLQRENQSSVSARLTLVPSSLSLSELAMRQFLLVALQTTELPGSSWQVESQAVTTNTLGTTGAIYYFLSKDKKERGPFYVYQFSNATQKIGIIMQSQDQVNPLLRTIAQTLILPQRPTLVPSPYPTSIFTSSSSAQ